MRPKKTLIEAAEKDGSMARLNQLLSASQILLCEANNLIEEGCRSNIPYFEQWKEDKE